MFFIEPKQTSNNSVKCDCPIWAKDANDVSCEADLENAKPSCLTSAISSTL